MKALRLVLFVLFVAVCFAMCQKNTLNYDLKNDSSYPAFNEEFICAIEGDSMAGYAFIASGPAPKETVLLAHGYPGFDTNLDLAHALRRAGKNVVHINYRGAWGNQGTYLYSNCLKDYDHIIDFLRDPELAQKLRIDRDNFTMIGRSFGGGIALIQGAKNSHVKKIVAISSVNYGSIMAQYKSIDELSSYKNYMKKQIMVHSDIDLFLQEMIDNKTAFNVLSYKDLLKNKKVLLLEDTDKNDIWTKQLIHSTLIKMDTDHGFIDKRLDMIRTIEKWLSD